MGMMNDNTQLPAWVQAKITKSASYLGAVKHFIEGEVELNEAVDDNPMSEKISVERHLIEKLVKAFDEYAPGPNRDHYLVGNDDDKKSASDLIDSIQALEEILMADQGAKQPKQLELPLNEEKQQMRKVTVEGKTYKVKK